MASTITVRVKDEDKMRFEKFCDDTGMNPSVAVNIFIKAVLNQNKIPFEISDKSNDLNEKLEKGYSDIIDGRTIPAEKAFSDIRKDYDI